MRSDNPEAARVLVAMSGGVDSSVAAKLLMERGFDCIGCTMRLYDNGDAGIPHGRTCCSLEDVEDARGVAYQLGMPYYVFNFTDCFREKVIGNFVRSYEAGRTPNPCIDCNRYLKFDKLFARARALGCAYIATGHYARIGCEGGRYVLRKAADESKDQSYVLYDVTQEKLAHLLFPLGELQKPEVRALAAQAGFRNARKRDSQDICFVPDGDYARAIERFTGKTSERGSFVTRDGRVLGTHCGVIHYTIGQRRGLGLSLPEPMYVCEIDAGRNTVVLGSAQELLRREAHAEAVCWISGAAPEEALRCRVKIRYRQKEQPATVVPTGADTANLQFDEPQRAVTPGQSAVFYDGETVLGGGILR
ncbi:MAG: tRNA 2-thiouridine(34) synthase MnmA [Oscillospiraceae bacterium]|nr:tRNA 2-thiouridine(34) synthase MnmA [Oscillospiraceae bacterium]